MEQEEIKNKREKIKGRAGLWSFQAGRGGRVRKMTWYEEVLKDSGPETKGFKEKTKLLQVEAINREAWMKKLK